MSQTPAQWQWTPAEEKQLRQLREKGVSLEEIAKMFHRGYSAVARKCRAMGLTNQTSPGCAVTKGGTIRQRATVTRAGKTTLPPLPSLRDK